jgi:hypothetical protein
MGKKINNLEGDEVPGPGNYSPKKKYNISNYVFPKEKRLKNKHNTNPGVGNYDLHIKNLKQGPFYKIGTSSRNKNYENCSPGPGKYEQIHNKYHNIGYSLGKNQYVKKYNSNPGPGQYDMKDKNKRNFTMKHKYYLKEIEGTPGPKYEYDFNKLKKKSPGYS